MDLAELTLDVARAEAGDWVTDLPDLGDIAVKVRGLGNADYRIEQAELVQKLPARKRSSVVELDKVQTRLLLDTVLKDWKNVSQGGADVPYSKETAERLLFNPALRKFRDGILIAGAQIADARAEVAATDSKN